MSGFSSYWKVNNSVLLYDEVKNKIIKIIQNNWNKAREENRYSSYWEFTKYEIGKYIRTFCSDLAKKKKIEENIVVCRITNLLSNNVDGLLECEKAELADLQHKLDNLYKHKAEGAFIRSRRKWIEEGEQNSAYFFRLEREQAKNSQIKKLMVDGNITDDPRNIAKFCAKFYSNLYTSKLSPKHMNDFFQPLSNIKQLSISDQHFCDASITLKEIEEAIISLKANKSPGTDGLSSEFYKLFSHVIAPFLFKVYEESIEKTVLPATLCQGLITIIPKSKKDPLFIDNWRPITLLNNDYKILALVLAKRLKHVLNSIIDETQSGFMQKRHISNNIRLVLDMMDYSDYINSDGFIFFSDYYKAFDTLEHAFLFQALEKIGFGDSFCRMIKMLYINGNSSIKLSNGTSPRFFLNRGVRQGCPVSPYLFLIATVPQHAY